MRPIAGICPVFQAASMQPGCPNSSLQKHSTAESPPAANTAHIGRTTVRIANPMIKLQFTKLEERDLSSRSVIAECAILIMRIGSPTPVGQYSANGQVLDKVPEARHSPAGWGPFRRKKQDTTEQ
ncbi:MAG: hypothetical protein AAGI25_15550 [Bacteroidota bacterium]